MLKKGISLWFFILLGSTIYAQTVRIASWNLKNLGKSKTEAEIQMMAEIVRDFDVLIVQEVVTSPAGAQAAARLADELNRKGAKWDYALSRPTISSPYRSERYAYFWKTSKLTLKRPAWLDTHFQQEIEREPFFIRLYAGEKHFTLVNFHALPTKHQPETEIKFFRYYPQHYPQENLIFCGDFNLTQAHSVFNPLKKLGYRPALVNQKTSLRQKYIQHDPLASEYDNIFYHSEEIRCLDSGIIPFYEHYPDLQEARALSDHVPVFMHFELL